MERIAFLSIKTIPQENILNGIYELHQKIFETDQNPNFDIKNGLLIIVALMESKVIGYKIGYDRKPQYWSRFI